MTYHDVIPCRACKKAIRFEWNKNGQRMPVEIRTGLLHKCPIQLP